MKLLVISVLLLITSTDAFKIYPDTGSNSIWSKIPNQADAVRKVVENAKKILTNKTHRNGTIDFSKYLRHTEIQDYLTYLADKFSDRVSLRNLVFTYERRPVTAVRISTSGMNDTAKPVILVEAGSKANEWISPMMALYVVRKLTEDITNINALVNVDWVIIPLLNPDGSEYSHETDRGWIKNRDTYESWSCRGVNLDRNHNFNWTKDTNDTCSNNYPGRVLYSEFESRALRDELRLYRNRTLAHLSIHSGGCQILYPYKLNGSYPANYRELHSVASEMAFAIEDNKAPDSPSYVPGNAALISGETDTGTSSDYALGVERANYSYIFNLPGGGEAEYDVPPSKILQTVTEAWHGVQYLAKHLYTK